MKLWLRLFVLFRFACWFSFCLLLYVPTYLCMSLCVYVHLGVRCASCRVLFTLLYLLLFTLLIYIPTYRLLSRAPVSFPRSANLALELSVTFLYYLPIRT